MKASPITSHESEIREPESNNLPQPTPHTPKLPTHSMHPLFALCLTFTILVLMHSFTTPIFEAPDEVWHYAYVRWLAKGNGLPAMDDDASGANQEVAQPPLYYAIAALFSAPFPDDDLDALFWSNPGFGHQAPGTSPDNKNMLIHTGRERFPWHGAVLTIHVTRITSLCFGLATVIAAWGLGFEIFGTRRGALVTGALIAFHPQFVFMCSVVSNDSAAAALSTAVLWSIACVVRRGLTARRALIAGLLVGLAALTKTSAILLLPLSGIVLLWQILRDDLIKPDRSHKPVRSIVNRLTAFQSAILPLVSFILAISLIGGWWYLRNTILYGDPLGMSSHLNTLWGRPKPATLIELLPEFPLLLRSFWAAYGWGHVTWAEWVYVILWAGSGYFVLRSVTNLLPTFTKVDKSAIDTLTIFAFAGLWFAGIFAALLQWMRQVEAPHGRLLFPALGAWSIVMTNGMIRSQKSKAYRWITALFLAFMFVITALAPGARILATFAPPRLRAPEAGVKSVSPVNLTFADQARLLGISVNKERAMPGDTFEVKACWEALYPMTEDYTVFIHLIGPENTRVAERHTYPGLGRFPTSLWPTGRAFCDVYHVPIETWAEGSIRYHLEVGLFNTETAVRLPAIDTNGNSQEPPIIGALIVDTVPTTLSPQHITEVILGDMIKLSGFDMPTQTYSGATANIILYWEALNEINEDLVAFVHLWRPGDSQPLAQHDSPPRNGWYPTSIWQPGDAIPDEHILLIPDDLPPGDYPLWAGLYRSTDSRRVNVTGPDGPYPHNLIPLGEISISQNSDQ